MLRSEIKSIDEDLSDHNLDSLDIVEMCMKLEDEFGLPDIPDDHDLFCPEIGLRAMYKYVRKHASKNN